MNHLAGNLLLVCLLLLAGFSEAKKPDVLFIAIDDMNDWTTLFDDNHPIQTPHLKRLAARGTLFNRAYCTAAGCNPSRTSIMTGLRPTTSGIYSNGQAWREKIPDAVSLPEYFAQHGNYLTRGAGKIYHHGRTGAEPKGRPSFQKFFKKLGIRGPGRDKNYNGYRLADKVPLANLAFDWGVHDQKMIDVDMCEWVEAQMELRHDQPLFLAAGIFNPHLPFYADAATFKRYPTSRVVMPPMPQDDMDDVGQVGIKMSDKEAFVYDNTMAATPGSSRSLQRMVQCYQAATDYADQMVGRLIDKLDATGRANNTVIVLWSDHGYHLGDKECGVKFTLWEKATHVPFIIVAPGVAKPGSVCETPVSLVDIYPTLVELAGLPPKADNDGLSLVPLLKDPNAAWSRPAWTTEGPGNHAIRTREYRYIRYHNGEEELYADTDPWNHTNLAPNVEFTKVLEAHRKFLPEKEAFAIPAGYQTIGKQAESSADSRAAKIPKPVKQATPKSPTTKPARVFVQPAVYTPVDGDLLLADFEGSDYGAWQATGEAFGNAPARADTHRNRVHGFLGKGFINSYRNGDKTTGELLSPPFKVERKFINFLMGGGNHSGKVGIQLCINGEVVREATGRSLKNPRNEEVLDWQSMDVAEFVGRQAVLKIVDKHAAGWGHTVVDHIFQSDKPMPVSIPNHGGGVRSSNPVPRATPVQAFTSGSERGKDSHSVTNQPNIIVMFIDDMGYGDIGPFGAGRKTPHLDRMAAEGMKLTDFYVSSSACTPSRAALLTGCYADRVGMGRSVVFPADERGLNPSEVTIAEVLKQGGYATGCFGKWHLGDQPVFMPLAQGFDVYEGIPYSNDMWVNGNKKRNFPPLPWMVQDKPVAHIPDSASQARITDAITDAAVRFIRKNKNQPFFAYVPHSAVHAPHMVSPERLDAAGGDVMTALVTEIDQSMGRIMRTLRELDLDKSTLVLFTNDNGGAGKTSSGPLRGHKFGPKYEGHMRVATLAWWPGMIPGGSTSSEIMATIDVLPTLASLTGQSVPSDRVIDGHDVSGILLGRSGAKSPHELLYYENDGIRRGKWKLVRFKVKADRFSELYDLENDPGERNNVAGQHPDIVKELTKALDAHVAEVGRGLRPAAFVDQPKALLSDSTGVPSLVEYLDR